MWKFVKKFKNRNKKKFLEFFKSIYNMIKIFLNIIYNVFIKEVGIGVEFECEIIVIWNIFKMFLRVIY